VTCRLIKIVISSVGVLEDKSSSSRILQDNFEVLGLGLEACVLDSITGNNKPIHTAADAEL